MVWFGLRKCVAVLVRVSNWVSSKFDKVQISTVK